MSYRRSAICLFVVLSILSAFVIHCSEKDKGTTPAVQIVEMNGALDFPDPDLVDLDDVIIGFGDHESLPDSSGNFRIKGNGHVVGVAMAYSDESIPMLMSVCPNPTQDAQLELSVRSTAVALAFLDPLICIADPTDAAGIILRLESLPELDDLEDLLFDKLSENPLALGIEDAEIDSSLSRLAMAYLDSYPADLSKRLASLTSLSTQDAHKSVADPPEIDPSYTFGGLKLTWEGGSTYKITNSVGRWCYCCTPTDTLFIFPNGDLLDWIVKDQPFPPSERTFDMTIVPGQDTARVNLFGYGFWSSPANSWDNLTPNEQYLAHVGGVTTVIMEFFTQVVSAACNVPRTFGNEKVAKLWKKSGWDFILEDSRIMQRVVSYLRANNPAGCAWWLTKQVISKAVTSPEFRVMLAEKVGIALTDGMLKKLAGWLLVPAKAVIATNNLSSVFKTVLGLTDSYYATRFKVWRDYTAFGVIAGQVANRSNGVGIQGATVKITGDDNNPLNPPHEKTTDAQGYYRFENIGVGERSITASKAGYKSATVGVTVEQNKTTTANIQLEVQSGGMTGKVLNDILTHNGVSPANFTGTVDITANEIGGQHRVSNSFAFDGVYTLNLPVGNWWVVATHDDYKPDSFSVAIPADGSVDAPRDLVLVPAPTMTGQVYINTNNQGSYEVQFPLNLTQVGLGRPVLHNQDCYFGGQPQMTMQAIGGRASSANDYDYVQISLNSDIIDQAGDYRIGGLDYFGCSGLNCAAFIAFLTSRTKCTFEQSIQMPMQYILIDDPESFGCNCGAGLNQSIYFTDWGTDLCDVIAGTFVVDLAGWNTCECSGDDTDNDGKYDSWDVSCAKARVEVDFRLLVGTDYLVTSRPSTAIRLPGNSGGMQK